MPTRTRDWFLLGMLAGLWWGIVTQPAAVGCLIFILLAVVIIMFAVILTLIYQHIWFALLVLLAVVGWMYFRNQRRLSHGTAPDPLDD